MKEPGATTHEQFFLQWHVTDSCNLRCTHCYQESFSARSDPTLSELMTIAGTIGDTLGRWNKTADVAVTGGEPLVHRELMDFLSFLDGASWTTRLELLTNATLVTDRFAETLFSVKKCRRIQVSLDGASALSHDAIRGQGSFAAAIRGIRLLISRGFDVGVMFTLQAKNSQDVPALVDLALEEAVGSLTVERMVPIGNARAERASMLSPDAVRHVFDYLHKRARQLMVERRTLRILWYRPLWALLDSGDSRTCRGGESPGAACSIGLDGVCIMPDATVLACRRLPIPIGNLMNQSLHDIWTRSELLWRVGNRRNLKGKCMTCELLAGCGGCRAIAYAYSGDYLAEDPQCWKALGGTTGRDHGCTSTL